jgi:uncharacterized membrane protein YgcG
MPIDAYRRDLRVFAFIFFIFIIVIFFFFIMAFFFFIMVFFFIMAFFFNMRFVILPPDPKKPLTLLYNFPTTLFCAPLGRGAFWGVGGIGIPEGGGGDIPGGGGGIPGGGGGADILL